MATSTSMQQSIIHDTNVNYILLISLNYIELNLQQTQCVFVVTITYVTFFRLKC